MSDGDGWTRVSLEDLEANPEKPGQRWELSPALGIDAFNLNVAVLEPGERLSQTHFHYHENQRELFSIVEGTARVETTEEGFDLEPGEVVAFEAGKAGAHVVHNPFEEPCTILAIGWPPEGRFPVHQLEETGAFLEERYGTDSADGDC
ncbi:cupin domain-containing protein [Natrialbaceae archaeon A-gly3]